MGNRRLTGIPRSGLVQRVAGPLLRACGACLAREIERDSSADEILQGWLIEPVAFVNVDGAPDVPVEAGVE